MKVTLPDGEGAGEHAQVKDEATREAQLRGDADDVDRNQAERHRDEDETGHLLGRREAQGALVGHGLDVVQKAERARDQHGDKGQDQVGRPLGKKDAGEHDAQQDDDAAMVGVPCLMRWRWGPSALTCWPRCSCFISLMKGGMSRQVMAAETKTARKTW